MSNMSERVLIMELKEKRRKQEQEKRLEELKQIEEKKRQEKESKQYEKDLLIACKQALKEQFEIKLNEFGIEKKFEFDNIMLRNELINKVAETTQEKDYLNSNYSKFLNEVVKIYELNEKYKEEKEKEEELKRLEEMRPYLEQQQRKQANIDFIFNIIECLIKIIKWSLLIAFGLILILFKFLGDLSKKV